MVFPFIGNDHVVYLMKTNCLSDIGLEFRLADRSGDATLAGKHLALVKATIIIIDYVQEKANSRRSLNEN